MRQFRTYGSARGAAGNRWPYRDPLSFRPSPVVSSLSRPPIISRPLLFRTSPIVSEKMTIGRGVSLS